MKKLLFIILALLIAVPAYPAQWNKLLPASTDQKIDWPAASQANNDALDRTLQGYREGLRLTYSSASTIVVTDGQVWVSNATGTVRLALSNAASTNVTFTNIDTGAEAASTTYYVYAIADAADSEAVTFKVSTSATAPSGVTYYKRLGSFFNDASSNIANDFRLKNDNEPHAQLGAWLERTSGVTYQALTDGFVLAYTTQGQEGKYLSGFTDSNSTPTTRVAFFDLRGAYSAGRGTMNIMFPVKRGDYWKTVSDTTMEKVYWIPLQ